MGFRFFTLGESDYNNSNVDQLSNHMTFRLENFNVTPNRTLKPRPQIRLEAEYTIPTGETVLQEATFILDDILCIFTKLDADDTLVIYYYRGGTLIGRIESGKVIVNTVRTLFLSQKNRYINTVAPTLKQFGGVLVFGLEVLDYIVLSDPPTFLNYPLFTGSGTRYLVNPIDGTYLQERLWLVGDNLTNTPNTPTASNEFNLVATDATVMNSTRISTTNVVKDGFVARLAVRTGESITTITNSQTSLFLTTTDGLMNIRADDSQNEAITANSALQFFTGGLANIPTKPTLFLSRYLIYATNTGLFFKDVGNFETNSKSVPDAPMNVNRSIEAPIEAIYPSRNFPVVYYLSGNQIKSVFISAQDNPPNGVAVSTYMKLAQENLRILKYAPNDNLILMIENEGVLKVFREDVDLAIDDAQDNSLTDYRILYTIPISKSQGGRSFTVDVFLKIFEPLEQEQTDWFQVDINEARGTLVANVEGTLQYQADILTTGEKGTVAKVEIIINPIPPVANNFEVLNVRF